MSVLILLSLSNSKSPPFVVSAILNFDGLEQYATICLKMSPKKLLCPFVLSRLDYCNSLLAGCPKYLLSKLPKVQNNAARLIFRTTRSAHITPMLHSLHWLPIEQRIEYKLSLICFQIISLRLPSTFHNFFNFTPYPFTAAPLFYRHPSDQNTILPNKILWSALFVLPACNYMEPTPCFCPPFYPPQLF